jgi:thioredoxin 1
MTIKIELFAIPGCGKCGQAKEALMDVVKGFDPEQVCWREIDIIKEMEYAIDLGVMGASALAINGELVFPRLPKPEALRAELLSRLQQSAHAPTEASAGPAWT